MRTHFSIPLNMFNNGTYKIIASLRKADPQDPNHTIREGFTNDTNSCVFSIQEDAQGTDYALLRYEALGVIQNNLF